MKLHIVDTGYFKLDGGAMFGVVPKQMWSRINPPDENNMCTWAMRCLLIEDGNQKILIDTGMGNKQDDKFRSHFEPHGNTDLVHNLKAAGFEKEEITDVILTHLHFDHCGGAVIKDQNGDYSSTFPNAKYRTNEKHWNWAIDPNMREKASFLKENFVPLKEQGQIEFIDVCDNVSFNEHINLEFVYGHTEAMMIPEISLANGKRLIYMADLLPSAAHVRLPYVMAYDVRPLVTLDERKRLYEEYSDPSYHLFFEHDKDMAIGKLVKNERSRYEIQESNLILF